MKPKACTMAFISGAQGFVDPVTDLNGILKQRRRWLNGSFFATMFYLRNMWTDVLVRGTACAAARLSVSPPLRSLLACSLACGASTFSDYERLLCSSL